MSEQSLDALLDRIAVTLADLMPYEALHIYEADEARRELVPVLARSPEYEEEIMNDRPRVRRRADRLGRLEPHARLDEPRRTSIRAPPSSRARRTSPRR